MLKHITFYLGKQNRKVYIIVSLSQTFKIIRIFRYNKLLNYEQAFRSQTLCPQKCNRLLPKDTQHSYQQKSLIDHLEFLPSLENGLIYIK